MEEFKSKLLISTCNVPSSPNIPLVEFLLANSVDCAYADEENRTAIYVCVINGHAEILKKILALAKVELSSLVDPYTGEDLLIVACNRREQAVIRELLHHKERKTRSKEVKRNASLASEDEKGGDHKGCNAILGNSLRTVSKSSKNVFYLSPFKNSVRMGLRGVASGNALLAACKSGNSDIVRTLLRNDKSDINLVNSQGWTALHVASSLGFIQIVNLLLEHGADANQEDFCKRTPLAWASIADKPNVIAVLSRHCRIDHRDIDDWTPLQLAINHGNVQSACRLVLEGAELSSVDLES